MNGEHESRDNAHQNENTPSREGKDRSPHMPCEAVLSDREFVPCEAAVSAVCLLFIAYFLFKFFRPFEDYRFADPPYDLISYFYALMISLFSTPLVLVVAAWNAWHQGVNAIRNRVLIYIMLMHIFIAIRLLLYLLVTISIYS